MTVSAPSARTARQRVLPQIGEAGQQLIDAARVVVIGAGGLGTPAATYLAAAGIGHLHIVDRDVVAASNLHRQFQFSDADVGLPKATVLAQRLRAQNPEITITEHVTRLDDAVFDRLFTDADVVVDCTDNFPTRFAINAAAARHRLPLVSGAGIRTSGQLGVFRTDQPQAACYRCLFDPDGAAAEACEEAGVLGPVVGIIGAWQAFEVLQLVIGQAPATSRWLHLDPETQTMRSHTIARDPVCPCHPSPH